MLLTRAQVNVKMSSSEEGDICIEPDAHILDGLRQDWDSTIASPLRFSSMSSGDSASFTASAIRKCELRPEVFASFASRLLVSAFLAEC
jgi:hypothetical protein